MLQAYKHAIILYHLTSHLEPSMCFPAQAHAAFVYPLVIGQIVQQLLFSGYLNTEEIYP